MHTPRLTRSPLKIGVLRAQISVVINANATAKMPLLRKSDIQSAHANKPTNTRIFGVSNRYNSCGLGVVADVVACASACPESCSPFCAHTLSCALNVLSTTRVNSAQNSRVVALNNESFVTFTIHKGKSGISPKNATRTARIAKRNCKRFARSST